MKQIIVALLLICAATLLGCAPKETPTLYIYCSETFWYVLQEEAVSFNRINGFRIILLPIRTSETSTGSDSVEVSSDQRTPSPWLIRLRTQTDSQTVDPLTTINPEIESQLQTIADKSFGDIFLSDSHRHIEKLSTLALSTTEFPVCYLTLTMLIPKGNPHRLHSIEEVLSANRRLGIVNPSLDGLGESSWKVLSRIFLDNESAIPMERIQLFERQYDLLEALELKKIDAALVWNATSQINFLLVKYAAEYNAEYQQVLREAARNRQPDELRFALKKLCEIVVAEKSFADEVPLTANPDERMVVSVQLVVLGSTSNYGYSKRFTDFMRSKQGKHIFQRFGFVTD